MRLLLFLLFFPFAVFAQQLMPLTYAQTQDIEYFRSVKNRTEFLSYTSQDGIKFSLGDTLVLAQPSTRSSQAYGSGNPQLGIAQFDAKEQQRFEFVQFGKRLLLRNNQFISNQSPDAYPTSRLSGERVIIKEIVAIHKGSKKKPLAVYLVLGEQNNRAFGIYKHLTVADLENALAYGEVTLLNAPMTRAEAIAKLKESKQLLDLEIITQDEYDRIKSEMTPIIKQ